MAATLLYCKQAPAMDEIITENVKFTDIETKICDNSEPLLLRTFDKPFIKTKTCQNCFLKGIKWSPDGLCLLTASEDYHLRLFDTPEKVSEPDDQQPVLDYREGGTVYDFVWFPGMTSSDPTTCVFASTSCGSPIHLWDAYTGSLRATYQPINQYDEVHSAYSLCFSPTGKLFSGYKKEIKIFDLDQPGRESESRSLKKGYQTGIISCITVNPVAYNFYALGSYDKTIGLYDDASGEIQCLLQAHRGGLTHVMFSPDGLCLYTGARQDPQIFCWDLRNPGKTLFTIERTVNTCQRIYFDLSRDGRHLITGSTNGSVDVYDITQLPSENSVIGKILSWRPHQDCVNGVSIHPFHSEKIATASGQRHVTDASDDEDESSDDDVIENCVKIWNVAVLR